MSRTDKDIPNRLRKIDPPYSSKYYWRYWGSPAPKWFVDHVWNNPQRVHVRDTISKAVADYNTNGDTDIETINVQHRHCAEWLYW